MFVQNYFHSNKYSATYTWFKAGTHTDLDLNIRRQISVPTVSRDKLSFSGLAQTFKLLSSKHTESSIWHARPFATTFQRQEYGLLGQQMLTATNVVKL